VTIPAELKERILRNYSADKCPIGTIARRLSVHHSTVKRVLMEAGLRTSGTVERRSLLDQCWPLISETLERFPTLPASRLYRVARSHGYGGGPDHFRALIASRRPPFDAFDWMLAVLQKKINGKELKRQMGDLPGLEVLIDRLYSGALPDRNKSLELLARQHGLTIRTICHFLGISTNTYSAHKRRFEIGGTDALFAPKAHAKKSDDVTLKSAVFRILHEPPSKYDINRTTWTMPLLRKVLSDNGNATCAEVIRTITRAAGYRWRKARVVLTSVDPAYSEKLKRIQLILAGLQSDEVFFSIDEYGPFAVKAQRGRVLVPPGEQPVVAQWQKSRGSLIVTAALELSSNQLTHFYSAKKNTAEMIKMMDILVKKYQDRRKVYLSWDAASWHISKQLNLRIEEHNAIAARTGGVVVDTAPLPSGAQFLNVIESVFSGMSRAIIHSSNYPTVDHARAAIDRYFEERNAYFQRHPQRAGKKIWGKEREPATFSDSSNCKDPRYR
jgi:transposase